MNNGSTDVLRRMDIEVSSMGEKVILRIGNSEIGFHYEDALKISQWMRLRAKQAKHLAGDRSRHWSAIGYLEDAEEAYKRGLR